MKKSLLATVAAVALIASAGVASAEGTGQSGMKSGGGVQTDSGPKAGGATQSEPAMKQGSDVKSGAQPKGKAETTGAGAEMKSEPKADMKADTKANGNKAKPSTTGQGAADQKSGPARSSAEEKSSPARTNEQAPGGRSATDTKSGAGMKQGADTKAGADGRSNAAADSKANASASVNLTSEQKTKIRTTVIQSGNAPKVSRSSINFNISVGTVVPRSVHFVTVPAALVEIHPAWRGYSYFIVDEEIIIVEPGTFRIVAVLSV